MTDKEEIRVKPIDRFTLQRSKVTPVTNYLEDTPNEA